ncbi:L-threonylcarbamoyladenylate synthase [Kushneria phosphatilytica]|uniref:Threonylcarbamoyl-AMP synthase n=1 Tax=Kushneria phosphatilytica TaxID=657387 RepID=A0A1S1NRT6_9GAMM|nr:Sua5/YciO/YrdC/YwlC family protein [Kushneria phosphatilytica]OHV07774.1 tRNA threonylcarbamoyladenosine biosynthesis protein RimN [Kushneria phosphatilytica]QEL10279.1 tRNA threonylcarbamoyladenosine biosynthesis protein RimN [Kushneria phosphatilytica]
MPFSDPGPNKAILQQARSALEQGEVVAYPTETVWGLGCDPDSDKGLEHVLALKTRPADKGLILIADSVFRCEPWLEGLDPLLRARFAAPAEVPTTWLVPDNGRAHSLVRGRFTSVAIRISTHPVAAALCAALGKPLVSTSANRAGELPCSSASDVRKIFGDRVMVIDGALGGYDRPSRIRDLMTGDILRD